MTPAIFWMIAAGTLVAIELATGTVYLLLIAVGLALGALAAWLGGSITTQILVAAFCGLGAVFAWRTVRINHPEVETSPHLDVGERVEVTEWAENRTASVQYRGANWQARAADGSPLQPGTHRVADVSGNVLVLEFIGSVL